jgi:hypothetical protein
MRAAFDAAYLCGYSQAKDGSYMNDASTVPGSCHLLRGRLSNTPGPGEVHLKYSFPILVRLLHQWTHCGDPRIVHQHVQLAKLIGNRIHAFSDARRLRYIHFHRNGLSAV